jgi:hypothetical protein
MRQKGHLEEFSGFQVENENLFNEGKNMSFRPPLKCSLKQSWVEKEKKTSS